MKVATRKKIFAFIKAFLPIWVGRYWKYAHVNRVRSAQATKWFLVTSVLGSMMTYVLAGFWLTAVTNVDAFMQTPTLIILLSFFLLNLAANPISIKVFRWVKQDFSALLLTDKHLPFSEAPDTHNRKFPIGWNDQLGWVNYGLRPALAGDEYFFPRHLMLCGNYGAGQKNFILRTIVQAMECTPDLSVIILDDSGAGMDFSSVADRDGISVISGFDDISRVAFWLGGNYASGGLIERRLHDPDATPMTDILLVTDYAVTNCMLGQNKRFSKVQSCFTRLITKGKSAGIHVLALAPAELFDSEISVLLRRHFDFLQFYSQNKVTVRYGDEIHSRKIEAARNFADLYLVERNGVRYECKQPVMNPKQLNSRLDKLTAALQIHTPALLRAFRWRPAFFENLTSEWANVLWESALRLFKFLFMFWIPVLYKERVTGRTSNAAIIAAESYSLRAVPGIISDEEYLTAPWSESEARRSNHTSPIVN